MDAFDLNSTAALKAEATADPPSYFRYDQNRAIILIHIVCMVMTSVFVLPIGESVIY